MQESSVVVRPFEEGDRNALREILKNEASYTTKGGKNPGKRECLCYMYSDYYFDFEPQNVLVAVDDGKVCGFIVVSTDSELFQSKMREIYIPKIRKHSLVWAYFHLICCMVNRKQDENGGGAFHINIDHRHQGKRIGTKLMASMEELLKTRGKRYMYLVTENKRTAGYKFYSKLGFKISKRYIGGSLMMVKEF